MLTNLDVDTSTIIRDKNVERLIAMLTSHFGVVDGRERVLAGQFIEPAIAAWASRKWGVELVKFHEMGGEARVVLESKAELRDAANALREANAAIPKFVSAVNVSNLGGAGRKSATTRGLSAD